MLTFWNKLPKPVRLVAVFLALVASQYAFWQLSQLTGSSLTYACAALAFMLSAGSLYLLFRMILHVVWESTFIMSVTYTCAALVFTFALTVLAFTQGDDYATYAIFFDLSVLLAVFARAWVWLYEDHKTMKTVSIKEIQEAAAE